ncbi:hypothetical protein KFE98_19570 [bacterium SCSIO 12741]|nr:hypothetical protein KFE98_19570 [bacterium SCSIO 12741]
MTKTKYNQTLSRLGLSMILFLLIFSSCKKDEDIAEIDISGKYCTSDSSGTSYSVCQTEPGLYLFNRTESFNFKLNADHSVTIPEQEITASRMSPGGSIYEQTYSIRGDGIYDSSTKTLTLNLEYGSGYEGVIKVEEC